MQKWSHDTLQTDAFERFCTKIELLLKFLCRYFFQLKTQTVTLGNDNEVNPNLKDEPLFACSQSPQALLYLIWSWTGPLTH